MKFRISLPGGIPTFGCELFESSTGKNPHLTLAALGHSHPGHFTLPGKQETKLASN